MPRRSYNQFCSVARALDLVGDRWTLLIVRELLVGSRRYTDLLNGLPGIGTNHLADRLKRLRAEDIVRQRELPPPAASTVYELTELGRGLEPVVVGLARWGLELPAVSDTDLEWRPEWTVVALRGRFDSARAENIREAYQFIVEDVPFWARVADGELETGLGHVDDPVVTVTADRQSFLQVASGRVALEDAIAAGTYAVEGDPEALRRAAAIFPARPAEPSEVDT